MTVLLRLLKVSSYIILLIITFNLNAQYNSKLKRFSAENIKGCSPFTVQIQSHDNLGNISRSYTYEEGTTATTNTFYTYGNPGTYQIVQLVGATITPKTDTLTITVLEPTPPNFTITYCDLKHLYIEINDKNYDYFQVNTPEKDIFLYRNQQLNAVLELNPTKTNLANPFDVNVKGFYENAEHNCGIKTEKIKTEDLNSPYLIHDNRFEFVCNQEYNLIVNGEGNPKVVYELEIKYDQNNFQTLFSGIIINNQELKIENLEIDPATKIICFRINQVSKCNQSTQLGETICYDYSSSFGIFQGTYATYVGNNIQIIFNQNKLAEYRAIKYLDGRKNIEIKNLNTKYIDYNIQRTRKYYYELFFNSPCVVEEKKITISPPFIEAEKTFTNRYKIKWDTLRHQFVSQFNYKINISNSDSTLFRIFELKDNPFYINLERELGETQKVWITATIENDITAFSNIISLDYENIVYIPTAFTPNGDGLNDFLEIFGLPTDEFTMHIFNSWGELIFVTNNKENLWNGQIDGKVASDGIFIYHLNYLTKDGNFKNQTGKFVILKK